MGRMSKRLRRASDTDVAEDEVGKEEGEGREKCRPAFIQHRVGVRSPVRVHARAQQGNGLG